MTHRLVKDIKPMDKELERLIKEAKKMDEDVESLTEYSPDKPFGSDEPLLSDVFEKIQEVKNMFEVKTKEYGRSEHHHGDILSVIFPDGIKLDPEDFTRWNLYNFLLTKIIRYGLNFEVGHPDSILDLIVYALMLMCEDERRGKC